MAIQTECTTNHSTTAGQHIDQTTSFDGAPNHRHGYAADKGAYLRRLKRIEGQVRGIARMIDEDKYCIDILTQVAAVNSAMHALSLGLLEGHLVHCVADAVREAAGADGAATAASTEAIDARIQEATQAIGRLLR